MGERRPRPERRPDQQVVVVGLRARRGQALPLDPHVGGLERAEPAQLPQSELAGALRRAAAEPDRRRPALGARREPHRRRRNLAAADAVRPLARRLHARHARGARPARRLLAPPLPGHAPRAAGRLLRQLVQVLQGRAHAREPARLAEGGAQGLRRQADLADGVRLPDESARPLRGLARGAGGVCRRGGPAREERPLRGRADPLHDPRRAPGRPAGRAASSPRPASSSRR